MREMIIGSKIKIKLLLNIRNNNIIKQYVMDCRLIPSNILRALVNNKKQIIVNKIEKLFKKKM
jgi:hypothetical protein